MKLKLVKAMGIIMTASMLIANGGLTSASAKEFSTGRNQTEADGESRIGDIYQDSLDGNSDREDNSAKESEGVEDSGAPEETMEPGSSSGAVNPSDVPEETAAPGSSTDVPSSTTVPEETMRPGSTPDTVLPSDTPRETMEPGSSTGIGKPTGTPGVTTNPSISPNPVFPSSAPNETMKPGSTPDTLKPSAVPEETLKPGNSPNTAKPSGTPAVTAGPGNSPAAASPAPSTVPKETMKPGSTPDTGKPSATPKATMKPESSAVPGTMAPGETQVPGEADKEGTETPVREDRPDGWNEIDGVFYWYEDGFRQGLEGAGKEIYDPDSEAWYWLDSSADGGRAENRDVYVDSDGGKWMRYDENGRKITGEHCQEGKYYYFEPITGAMMKGPVVLPDGRKVFYDTGTGQMVKGDYEVNGVVCHFDEVDGHLWEEMEEGISFWMKIEDASYWYVDWIRQGWKPEEPDYAGEELFDPVSGDWVWLDGTEQGRMAVNKLIYLNSQADEDGNIGKWVFYGGDGHMLRGWSEDGMYYFDPVYGTMARGGKLIDNMWYEFDPETGIKLSERALKGFEE